jgi:hypothetical protein
LENPSLLNSSILEIPSFPDSENPELIEFDSAAGGFDADDSAAVTFFLQA